MCINVDWNTLFITTLTCAVASWVIASRGAKYAFENDEKLNSERKLEKELSDLYTFYGHLLSLYNGYDSWANSFIQIHDNFCIENNISKIKNLSSYEWGLLGFITKDSIRLYEQIFRLERDLYITEEKTIRYANNKSDDAYTIVKKYFVIAYAEIMLMMLSLNNYTRTYYKKILIDKELKTKLNESKDKLYKVVEDIIKNQPKSKDNDADVLEALKEKKDWYLWFEQKQKAPKFLENWMEKS